MFTCSQADGHVLPVFLADSSSSRRRLSIDF